MKTNRAVQERSVDNLSSTKEDIVTDQRDWHRYRAQELEETNAQVRRQWEDLKDQAAKSLGKVRPDVVVDEANLGAQMGLQIIAVAERNRRVYKSFQAVAVVSMARGQLWSAYPPTEKFPAGFGSLRKLLGAAELGGRTIYQLALLGDLIVPYCDSHGIDIGPYVSAMHYYKLVEVLPHIGRQIRDSSSTPKDIRSTLEFVKKSPNREVVRGWRKSQTDRPTSDDGSAERQPTKEVISELQDHDATSA